MSNENQKTPEPFTVNDIPVRDIDEANMPRALKLMEYEVARIDENIKKLQDLRIGAASLVAAMTYEMDRRRRTISVSRELPAYVPLGGKP
jgi:hypothetical protein